MTTADWIETMTISVLKQGQHLFTYGNISIMTTHTRKTNARDLFSSVHLEHQ